MTPMALLYFLADAFIKAFGITQPTAEARRRAAFFILTLMIVLLLAVAVAGIAVRYALR